MEEKVAPRKVAMAPKAKAKIGPRPMAKVKAKAKVKAVAKPKAKGKALAKAKMRMRVRARGNGALKRPAGETGALKRPAVGREPEDGPPGALGLWQGGHTVRGGDLSVDALLKEKHIVVEEGRYFHRECKVAGQILAAAMDGDRVMLRLRPTGTTDEGVLKLQSGTPGLEVRLVLCKPDCGHEETAEDLIHALRIRRRRGDGAEEPWADNLEKVHPAEIEDELAALRGLQKEREPRGGPEMVEQPSKQEKKTKKEKSKGKKKKRSKKEQENARGVRVSSPDSSSAGVPVDGSRAKLASQKTVQGLFQGTGMDGSERVRQKVARLAKKYVRKRGRRSSSSTGSSSGSSKGGRMEDEEDTVFQQAAKVRGIAESFPGVLSHQALNQMRANLMQSLGEEDRGGPCQAVAVQYFRQVLQKKTGGAPARELLSLCAAADFLVRARPAQALDLILQRVKSAESTLGGTHWSVSQKLELLPPEQATLTATAEMREAQRIAQEEAKTRWMASLPEGRLGPHQKGGGKGKGTAREDYRKGGDGKKGGKHSGSKGDGKKKEEGGARTT